jgi:D-aminopeptidase
MWWDRKVRSKTRIIGGAPPLTYTVKDTGTLKNYRIYGNTVNSESVGDLVTSGEHAGEYKVPVTVSNGADTLTTPIYLPEQIKKVGDYSDYIDYGSQKFVHRVVRKVFDGTETFYAASDFIDFYSQLVSSSSRDSINCACNYFICLGANAGYAGRKTPNAMNVTVHYGSGGTVMRFYFNDSSGAFKGEVAFKSQLADWYANGVPLIVDYIIVEPVEEQVTLPTLPTIAGTNTLSVGTGVQPSKVMVKGKLKE